MMEVVHGREGGQGEYHSRTRVRQTPLHGTCGGISERYLTPYSKAMCMNPKHSGTEMDSTVLSEGRF